MWRGGLGGWRYVGSMGLISERGGYGGGVNCVDQHGEEFHNA